MKKNIHPKVQVASASSCPGVHQRGQSLPCVEGGSGGFQEGERIWAGPVGFREVKRVNQEEAFQVGKWEKQTPVRKSCPFKRREGNIATMATSNLPSFLQDRRYRTLLVAVCCSGWVAWVGGGYSWDRLKIQCRSFDLFLFLSWVL